MESGIQQAVTYTGLFTGHSPVNLVLESVATKTTQLILQIDRSNDINEQKLKSELIFIGRMSKNGTNKDIWEKVIEICAPND